jgi:hypothetical protein
MKWTDDKIEKLTKLVESGGRPAEIAEILGVSLKSINLKMYRLGLKVIYTTTTSCKNCGNSFESYSREKRMFCSKSCSATFNNSSREHSEDTKQKISDKLKVIPRKRKKKHTTNRICKICNELTVVQKHKSICENCKTDYYQFYRHECNFKFSVFDYPNEFDLDLIEVHGWYSPSNKRNNLNGVSKDHMYSVMDGYKNKVSSEIISHPANCKLMLYSDNSRKKDNSSITLEDLLKKISHWDKKYS